MTFGLVPGGAKRGGGRLGSTRFSGSSRGRGGGSGHRGGSSSSGRGGSSYRGGSSSGGRGGSFRGGSAGRGRGDSGAAGSNANRNLTAEKVANSNGLSIDDVAMQLNRKFDEIKLRDQIDEKLGFARYTEGAERLGWLANLHETLTPDPEWEGGRSAVDFYFIQEDNQMFKATIIESPYFLIACKEKRLGDVEEYIRRKFEQTVERIVRMPKEDLDLPNHLLGHRRIYLKLFFRNTQDLMDVRRVIAPAIQRNSDLRNTEEAYAEFMRMDEDEEDVNKTAASKQQSHKDGLEYITDIREYDVPYVARIAIDFDYRVGLWYSVKEANGHIGIERRFDKVLPAEPVVMAFDIETSKAPLKFPDSNVDQIMMISYMVDRQGYLITNREIVSEGIVDFDYSPRPGEYDGPFIIFNEEDEKALLERFFEHIREVKPAVFVTYNGDFFDWPFIETRANFHNMDMYQEIGFVRNNAGEFQSSYAAHIDCYYWVKRDSYLPVGSQGLKAVTKAKLGYDPKELDPELMTRFAAEQPQVLADYSVSDAVATYYLYMKYVHPFIFSLCNIIPLPPDDVLRKGSGTLCEMLLMVEAYKANVIMPNKHVDKKGRTFEGHLLESETYVGGHVEALESGVFRSDLPTHFRLDPTAFDKLLEDLDRALKFSIEVEEKKDLASIVNYDEVRDEIARQLMDLRDTPNRRETPLIYHLDVAAMYPNIILTNRLQPPALIDEQSCLSCDFYKPDADCQRKMKWSWRGEFFPADRSEVKMIRNQLEIEENFPSRFGDPTNAKRTWHQLSESEQQTHLRKRVSDYCRKVYRRIRDTKVEEKESIICQRENSFYVDTVRNFRDRRYEYKGKLKTWKRNLDMAAKDGDLPKIDEAKKMTVLMDSLQLAHKCILNSFYGYVMRKGSRWYSMEMAGIVCLTGANIIRMARQLVERIGRPLELDTDGIWCILPGSFPENFTFRCANGKTFTISYPCSMLNHLVHDEFTNHQYQELVDPESHKYETRSENSIFFEVDGPYRAMILPASKEEDKLLKKRYAVFNDDGSLAELKGFEVKRRGELKIIKIFQEEVFRMFLGGTTLEECYAEVATVANRWLDILYTKGKSTSDEELFDYISENRSMSKTLEEYGTQKSTSISTAKRLAEFLGDQMVKDKGLACKFVIAAKPAGAPVAERAIPVAIFSAEESVKRHFLRKWIKDNGMKDFDIRSILDWQYYLERLGSTIQKLVTIPAALQKVRNPVPRIRHPDWLLKRVTNSGKDVKQNRIDQLFAPTEGSAHVAMDMEDFGRASAAGSHIVGPVVHRTARQKAAVVETELELPDVMPDMHVDYRAWLAYQKIKWRIQRRDRKRGLDASGDEPAGKRRTLGGDVSSFFQYQNRSIMRGVWEVVQIVETDQPGVFRMWVMVDRQLYAVSMSVPRKFYVNSRTPDTNNKYNHVERTLPRSHVPYHLYEFVLSEQEYQECSDVYKSFAWHHDTIGVYETKVPLLFRSLSLGSVVTLDRTIKSARDKTMDDRYALDDFIPKTSASANYLLGDQLHYVYLYHSNTDDRHVFGLVVPQSGKLRVAVVDPYKNEDLPNLARDYGDKRARRFGDVDRADDAENQATSGIFPYPETLTVTTSYHVDEKGALRALQRALNEYRDERRGPTAILVQTPRQLAVFASHLRIINEFPCVAIPSRKVDNMYPALAWQRMAGRRLVSSFLEARDWLVDRLNFARYSNVPLGNIESDSVSFLSDLFYARALERNDVVQWYSSTERPDLGGREDDDNFYSTDEFVDTELNYPGSYNTICIEYQIHGLPINTILQSTYINEIEGADQYAGLTNADMKTIEQRFKDRQHAVNGEDADPNVDPDAPSFAAYKALRDLVKNWSKEYYVYGNPYGKTMLDNFYRWISSPSSKLFDPSIYGYLHGLMKKVLMQLLSEFKRLGAKVVFANFNKIIIATTKTNLKNAQAYDQYMQKALTEKDVFRFIKLEATHFWDQLLWMDAINYGGVTAGADVAKFLRRAAAVEREHEFDDEVAEESADAEEAPPFEMSWNIQRFLPPFLQDSFTELIAEFLLKLHHLKQQRRDGVKPGDTPVRGIPTNMTASQVRDTDAVVNGERRLVKEYFTRKLLELIPQVQRAASSVFSTEEERWNVAFPQLPGSHLKLDNAALELIKMICKVFGLAKDLENEVRVMRRTLLNLISVREFCAEAEFHNPCESFILPHVICSFCQHCRDLDLSMDDVGGVEDGGDVGGAGGRGTAGWLCPRCHNEYDNALLEELLVEMLQRNLLSYQLQDLVCAKCKTIKEENVREHCRQCANPFTLQTKGKLSSATVFRRKLTTLGNVAAMYRMPFLGEAVAFYAERC